ncbi:hypothetical protein MD484_g4824, partial [Candolleomyces efflorescens]
MSRILSLSPTAILPKPYPYRLHIPGHRVPKHELYLDLSSVAPKGRSSRTPGPIPDGYYDLPPTRADWLPSIREAIANNKDIDAINIYCCTPGEWGPEEDTWKALSGCQPTHLELNASVLEECEYEGLQHVEPAWPLKSVYVQCCGGYGEYEWGGDSVGPKWAKPSFPACYAGVETVVLHYGLDQLYFYPEGGARNLRSLTILENEYLTTFAFTVRYNPRVLQTLRSVTLGGRPVAEPRDWDIEQMKDFFRNSKALERVELALNDQETWMPDSEIDDDDDEEDDDDDDRPADNEHPEDCAQATCSAPPPYLGLSDVLPSSLTSVSFRGPANELMLKDLDSWIRNAKRADWLPNMHTLAFQLDSPNHLVTAALDAAAQRELDAKIKEFFDIISKRAPAVRVVEPRPVKELEYPLEI